MSLFNGSNHMYTPVMLNSIWIFLCRLGCYLWMRLHLYQVKSWIVRVLTEGAFAAYPVQRYPSIRDLEAAVNLLKWTGDTWRQGWDAISYPGRCQYLIDRAMSEPGIDCDEFGEYISTAIRRSLEDDQELGVRNPTLCTVMWIDSKGKAGGHNVCMMELDNGQFAYMDYGMPIAGATKEEVVGKVRVRYAGKDSVSIGWALSDPDTLSPIEVHWA